MNRKKQDTHRPTGVVVIVAVNILGWVATEGAWVYLYLAGRIPEMAQMGSYWERSYLGLVHGFSVADFIWSNIALLAGIAGLWKMKAWGWTAALMANTIWIYSMTFTLVRDLLVGVTFGMVFFLFFALFALGSTVYLWKIRFHFWKS